MTGMEPLVGGMKNNWGNACNSIFHISYFEFLIVKWFLEFLEFLELFWIFFLVLETYLTNPFVLELFLNSKFLQSTVFVTTFLGAPCLDLLFVIKYYFNSA